MRGIDHLAHLRGGVRGDFAEHRAIHRRARDDALPCVGFEVNAELGEKGFDLHGGVRFTEGQARNCEYSLG
jgi:hypothetical protein